ncbi:MAG: energy-coupling factor transporter transmembrane protein EcfT [Clostridiales Family XIII bacterium]|jgi:energy-coupling factor transport system permease protein|nr:energy-coupling factor transporter transmembrane protein EcfT [Clostridiales Family XIII bacterium]
MSAPNEMLAVTRLARLDPRPKLMLMASASTAAMLTNNLVAIVSILCVLMISMTIGGMSVSNVIRRAKSLFALIVFLFIIQIFFSGIGDVMRPEIGIDVVKPLLKIGKFNLYVQPLQLAAVLSLRLLIIVLSALILLEGDARDYLLALVQMKVPYEIAFMVIVGLHFLPILREETINIYCCMQLRGKDFKKISLIEKLKAYISICLPILVSALRRADEMSISMETRGFRAKPSRTNMRRLTMHRYDVILTILYPVVFIGLHFMIH